MKVTQLEMYIVLHHLPHDKTKFPILQELPSNLTIWFSEKTADAKVQILFTCLFYFQMGRLIELCLGEVSPYMYV